MYPLQVVALIILWLPLLYCGWLLKKTWRTNWQPYTNTVGEKSLFLLATLRVTSQILLIRLLPAIGNRSTQQSPTSPLDLRGIPVSVAYERQVR